MLYLQFICFCTDFVDRALDNNVFFALLFKKTLIIYKGAMMRVISLLLVSLFAATLTGCFQGDPVESYKVNTTVGEGGYLSPSWVLADAGEVVQFQVVANDNYRIGSISGCDGELEGDVYSTAPLTQACDVTANFVAISVALPDREVYPEIDATLSVAPDANYGFIPGSVRFTPSSGPEANLPAPLPEGVTASTSLLEFKVQLQNPGDTATITITYDEPIGLGHRPMKYGPQTPGGETTWYLLPQEMYQYADDGKSLMLTITDGEMGDTDGEKNGIIEDPIVVVENRTVKIVHTDEFGGQFYTYTHNITGSFEEFDLAVKLGLNDRGSFFDDLPTFNLTYPETTYIGFGCQLKASEFVPDFWTGSGTVLILVKFNENSNSCIIFANDYRTHTVNTAAVNGVAFSPASRLVHRNLFAVFDVNNTGQAKLTGVKGCTGAELNAEKTSVHIPKVLENCTLIPEFEKITVTAKAGVGGTITPATTEVEYNSTATFTVTPNAGFTYGTITGCPGERVGDKYTTTPITAACEVTATFEPITYTVSVAALTNGTISLPASTTVVAGSELQFTLTPNTGYRIANVSVDACQFVQIAGSVYGGTYLIPSITNDCTISASFTAIPLPVSATAGDGGSIALNVGNPASVPYGSIVSVTATANPGKQIASIKGCGLNYVPAYGQSVLVHTINTPAIVQECRVDATFTDRQLKVTADIIGVSVIELGGTVEVQTNTVTYGQSAVFTITPKDTFALDSISGCGEPGTLNGNTYTTAPLTDDCNLIVKFTKNTFAVELTIEGEGQAQVLNKQDSEVGQILVAEGEQIIVGVQPAEGYELDSVSGCGGFDQSLDFPSLFGSKEPISQACAITVVFKPLQFVVTTQFDDTQGSVSPAEQRVNYNDTASFTITPAEGFDIASAAQGGECEGGGKLEGDRFITSPITADGCVVVVEFERKQYQLLATAVNGSVVSDAQVTVEHGTSHTFSLVPDTGYEFERVEYTPDDTACAGAYADNGYTISSVTKACAYSFHFKAKVYTITTSADYGGSWSPATAQFTHGQQAVDFTLTVPTGYEVNSVSGCGNTNVDNVYTVANITANCTLTATLKPQLSAPAITTIQAGNAEVALEWSSVANAESYKVYYATESIVDIDNHGNLDGNAVMSFNTNSGTIAALENGTVYYFRVTSLKDSFESDASTEQQAKPVAGVATTIKLNDTGATACAGALSADVSCPNTDAPGQDAEYGRDADLANNNLTKQGGGAGSLDLTKLDAAGMPLAIQDQAWDDAGSEADGSQWSCVQDNVTGIVWDSQVGDAANYRYSGASYVWYNPNGAENGGYSGPDFGCVDESCDAQSYVAELNSKAHCGFTDWRLPTMPEMYDVFGSEYRIDTGYFPHIRLQAPYWTSNTLGSMPSDVFCVVPGVSPSVMTCLKDVPAFVMPVRKAQ